MKNTNILKGLTFVLLVWLLTWTSFANMQWEWKQKLKWNVQWQQSQMNRDSNFNRVVETEENKNSFKVEQSLTQKEIDRLVLQYEDEYAAIWIYNYFYELYELQVFKNIADSEQKHLNAIIELMNAYDLETPTELSPEFLEEVSHLRAMWEWSLKEALEAWVLFEIRDIEDIAYTISISQNEDIRKVMLNIWGGSFNHLRWFLTNLEKQGFTTDIDYSEFLSSEDLKEKGLKDRFIPYLENMGIEIDSSLLKTKDDKEGNNWNQKWKSGEVKWGQKGEEMKLVQQQRKEAFKSKINNEMWDSLRSMNSDRLQIALNRLEVIIENTKKDNSINQEQKQSIMPIYNALKEVLENIIN